MRGVSYPQFVADQIYHKRGRYRYSRDSYGKAREPMRIFCSAHGWFEQIRGSHDAGCRRNVGCPKCGDLTTAVKLLGVKVPYNPRVLWHQYVADQIYHKRGRFNYAGTTEKDVSEGKVVFKCLDPTHPPMRVSKASHDHSNAGSGCGKCAKALLSVKHSMGRSAVVRELREHGHELGGDYRNLNVPISYTCGYCGGEHSQLLTNMRRGKFLCPSNRYARSGDAIKLDYDEVWLEFAASDCELLSAEYPGNVKPVKFRCSCGEVSSRSLASLRSGHFCCLECGEARKLSMNATPYAIGATRWSTYGESLSGIGVKVRDAGDDFLEAQCFKCGKWFMPTQIQASSKVQASKRLDKGEGNLYCSDVCKDSCPVYKFNTAKQVDPRSELYVPKSEATKARDCQSESLKELQCDEVGHNYCEKCGDIIDVELHHTLPVSKFGAEAVNSAGHLLLCVGCHVELHGECA